MKKLFKLQKIMFFVYLIMLVVSAIYSLSFMTSYQDLFGFSLSKNQGIISFYDNMISFNNMIFWFSLIGCISILAMFMLELKSKIPDKFALIVTSAFIIVNIVLCIISFVKLPQLMSEYNAVDFTYMYLEDTSLTKDSVYVLKYSTFYLGYALYTVLGITSLGFGTILWINNIKYTKQLKDGECNDATE